MTDEARPYFPMFVDISHKKVVVVGAGTIAKRRIRTLVDFTENLTVIAPEVNPELLELQSQGKILILKKQYQREDIYDADLVIAATIIRPTRIFTASANAWESPSTSAAIRTNAISIFPALSGKTIS